MPVFEFDFVNLPSVETGKGLGEQLVGRKGESLFRLVRFDTPVPDFFVVNSKAFESLMGQIKEYKDLVKTGLKEGEIKTASRQIKKKIEKSNFTEEVSKEIVEGYSDISGFMDSWVSVRSSVALPESMEKVSFSGQLKTVLNVKGKSEVCDAIKEVYSSLFNQEVLRYLLSKDANISQVSLPVVVQKMIQSEVSGIAYTVDPITQDARRMAIEAVFGLGDVVSTGELTPDIYVVNKKTDEIIEKKVIPQEWMETRKIGRTTDIHKQKVRISSQWQNAQKLQDVYIQELAEICKRIEKNENAPVDIEWAFEGGKLWILQTKIVKTDGRSAETEIKEVKEKAKISSSTKKRLLMTGIGASQGEVTGDVLVCRYDKNTKIEDINQSTILVVDELSADSADLIARCKGVVADSGGITSDAAIISRESGVPAVMGTHIATSVLKDGDKVLIDGNSGAVYGLTTREDKKIPTEGKRVIKEQVKGTIKENTGKRTAGNKNDVGEEKKNDVITPKNTIQTATKVYLSLDVDQKDLAGRLSYDTNGIGKVKMSQLVSKSGKHLSVQTKGKDRKKFVLEGTNLLAGICAPFPGKSNKIILWADSLRSDRARKLTGGKASVDKEVNPKLAYKGSAYYVDRFEELLVLIDIVKELRNKKSMRNISVALNMVKNADDLVDIKRQFTTNGLRRSSTFNLWLVVDNPAGLMQLEKLAAVGIDGLIFDTVSLYEYSFGVDLDNVAASDVEEVDFASEVTLSELDKCVELTQSESLPLIVNVPSCSICKGNSCTRLIVEAVKRGVSGVCMSFSDPKTLEKTKKKILKTEKNLITKKK